MFRKKDCGNVSDDEFINIVSPHDDYVCNFLENKLIPQFVALYIASGYRLSALWEESFKCHYRSAIDIFNYNPANDDKVQKQIINILENEYLLKVIETEPILKIEDLSK